MAISQINVTDQLLYVDKAPLDAKNTPVDKVEDLNLISRSLKYEGLTVYVKDEGISYVYTKDNIWKPSESVAKINKNDSIIYATSDGIKANLRFNSSDNKILLEKWVGIDENGEDKWEKISEVVNTGGSSSSINDMAFVLNNDQLIEKFGPNTGLTISTASLVIQILEYDLTYSYIVAPMNTVLPSDFLTVENISIEDVNDSSKVPSSSVLYDHTHNNTIHVSKLEKDAMYWSSF